MSPVRAEHSLCQALFRALRFAVAVVLLASLPSRSEAAPAKRKPTQKAKTTPVATVAVKPFDLNDVALAAEKLAKEPFREPRGQVPRFLTEITYDQWRGIRFRPEQSLWREEKLPFEVQFFHPGLYYDRTIQVNEITAEGVRPVKFSPNVFDYGDNRFASQVPQDLGFAGFRLHFPLKTSAYKDEVIVFLGASYFRAVGKDNVFGLSARGLSVDTAMPAGEEFPQFREFWMVQPARTAKELVVYALLDSPRVTGAYRFVIHPGDQTLIDVDAKLFGRGKIGKLGVAPLTSMFFHGENTIRSFSDYRPEVHDSDGLMIHSGTGEWIWRPIDNPSDLQVSGFQVAQPKGFGLIQRDRDFDHYQDLEAVPQMRPGVWITPTGDWGEGTLELVEIPTKADINDNIVAYWVPKLGLEPGKAMELSYRMAWLGDAPDLPPAGRVEATRRDRGTAEEAHRFVIDFAGSELKDLPAETVLRGVVTTGQPGQAELVDQQLQKNAITGTWRLVFQVKLLRSDPVELRAFLQQGDRALTETWSYLLRE